MAPQVPAYLTAPTALFNAGFQDLDSLHRRLGEIHDDQILGLNPQGEVFLRGFGTTFNYTSDRSFTAFGFNSSGDYAGTQLGGNWIAANNTAGTLRLGLTERSGGSRGTSRARSTARARACSTPTRWLAPSPGNRSKAGMWTRSLWAACSTARSAPPTADKRPGSMARSIAASLEAGYPIPLGWQRLSLEPEVQLATST